MQNQQLPQKHYEIGHTHHVRLPVAQLVEEEVLRRTNHVRTLRCSAQSSSAVHQMEICLFFLYFISFVSFFLSLCYIVAGNVSNVGLLKALLVIVLGLRHTKRKKKKNEAKR